MSPLPPVSLPPIALPPSLSIAANWSQAVERTIRQSYATDDLQYVVGASVVPGQGGQPMPVMTLVLTAPGPQIGTKIQAFAMADCAADEDTIEKLTFDLAQQLLGQRSAMLAQALTKP